MPLVVQCSRCKQDLDKPGALVISPVFHELHRIKYHLCQGCLPTQFTCTHETTTMDAIIHTVPNEVGMVQTTFICKTDWIPLLHFVTGADLGRPNLSLKKKFINATFEARLREEGGVYKPYDH